MSQYFTTTLLRDNAHVPRTEVVSEKGVVMMGGGGRGGGRRRMLLEVVGTATDLQLHSLAQELRQSVCR